MVAEFSIQVPCKLLLKVKTIGIPALPAADNGALISAKTFRLGII
jgi:hypothetical protein